MKKRAEQEAETRLRITESAVELHGTLGPARTSMSAVADHAGVRRSTLYRHFPDDTALFAACSAHWADQNPPPDIEAWGRIEDPDQRFRTALAELYAYFDRSEQMLSNLLRDEATIPAVADRFQGYHLFITAAGDLLMAGRGSRGRARKRDRAAIGHALAFGTWRSLVREQGLDAKAAVELMADLVSQ